MVIAMKKGGKCPHLDSGAQLPLGIGCPGERQLPERDQPATTRPMPQRKPLPPAQRLWELYDYKPLTGELVLRVKRGRPVQASTKRIYRGVTVDGTGYQAHRVIWKWITGLEPAPYLDHVNRNKHDNRVWNLREVSSGENVANRAYYKRRKPSSKGYYWCNTAQCWKANVTVDGARATKNCATEEEAQSWVRHLRDSMGY